MNNNMYNVGDELVFKKKHPCGANTWQVIKIGLDYKLKCKGCGREIIIPRVEITKHLKK